MNSPPAGPHVVEVSEAAIVQEGRTVLSHVSLTLEKGAFAYLLGRTGSGKSSFLKTLYADLPLVTGHMQVAGYSLRGIARSKVPHLRRKLGVIFQDFQLFTDRTVAENLYFVLRATGWKSGSAMKNRITEVLMRVGLGSADKKMPHQLSGGEQQRVVIARALLNEPALLIADEPTGNLDPEVSEGIFKLFREINTSGTAVLMATHDHLLAAKYSAKTFRCAEGKIEESSPENRTYPL